jgi:hypothetical protein
MSGAATPDPTAQAPSGYGAYVPGRSGRAAEAPGPTAPYGAVASPVPGPPYGYTAPQSAYGYPGQQFPGAGRAPQVPQLRRGPDGAAVMRPSRRQIWRSAGAIAPLFVGAVVLTGVRRGVEPALLLAGVAVVLCGLYVILELRRSRIVVTPLGLERTRILGGRSFPLADVGQVLLFRLRADRGADRSTYLTTLVRDRAGRRLLTVRSDVWDPDEVRALAGSLGVAPTQLEKVFTPRELEAAFPGTVPYIQRNPVAVAVLVTVVLVVVIAAGVVLANS